MPLPDYRKNYVVLGVFQDDDWGTVRNAYKRLIRKWHPDRFQATEQRDFAENKCKEINLSYQALDDFYQKHGHLPQVEAPDQDSTIDLSHMSPDNNGHPNTGTTAPAETAPTWDHRNTPTQGGHRGRQVLVALAIAVAFGVWFSESLLTDFPEMDTTAAASNTNRSTVPVGTSNEDHYPAELLSPDASDYTKRPLIERNGDSLPSSTDASSAATGTRLPFIVVGSTKQDVLALQGRPTRETEDTWEYGLSRISFRHGRVWDWYENPMNPLKLKK